MWMCKAYDYSLYYYSLANILWIYFNVSCHWTRSVTVNLIYSRGFVHCQYYEFLKETKADYVSFSNTALWCLNSDKVLLILWFFTRRIKIEIFLTEKNCPQPLLLNTEWLGVNLIMVPNEFNQKTEDETVCTCKIYTSVKSFQ